MLILTRKSGTSIRVGGNVVIHVIHTGRSSVKIGVEAPENIRIIRGELQEFPPQFDHYDSVEDALLLQH